MKTKERKSPEQIYKDFWKPLICDEKGEINKDQLIKELSDFHYMLGEASTVYCYATGNRLSKPLYDAKLVNRYINKNYHEIYSEKVENFIGVCMDEGIIDQKTFEKMVSMIEKYF